MENPAAEVAHLVLGRWVSQAIGTAAELQFADHLVNGPLSVEELAKLTNTHAPSVYRLLRALSRVGIFQEEPNKHFSNTPRSETLRSGTQVAHMARFNNNPNDLRAWAELPNSIRTGKSGWSLAFGMPQKAYFKEHPEAARFFASSMTAFAGGEGEFIANAYDFSQFNTLADIGGSEGHLIGSLLRRHPHLRGIVLDLPDQVETAPKILEGYGVADRCTLVGGDFFKEVPGGADAYMMRRTLHNWGDEDGVRILKQIHRASKPGTKLLIIEIMLGHPEIHYGGTFVDIQMLIVDEGGRQRTRQDFENMMSEAGFRFVKEHFVKPTPFSLLEAERI